MSLIYVNTTVVESPLEGGIASASGLILHEASQEFLRTTAAPMPMFAAPIEWPERIDPRNWLKIESQRSQGSCQGHSLTSVCEGLYYLQTGGAMQLSRQYAYIASQRQDGIVGDRGSTVSGGVKVALRGLPREELWPYTGSYHRDPPTSWQACEEDGANYIAGGQTPIKTYEEALAFLASGIGWIHTGFSWGDIIDRQAAKDRIIRQWSASGGGGHSVCFAGYNPEAVAWGKDSQPLLIQPNSWSGSWGDRGYAYWDKEAFDAMCAHRYSEVVGIHGFKLGPNAVLPVVK